MERNAILLEAAVIGGAILLSTSPEATPLRAADSAPSENTIHLVTPLPETYGKPTDMSTAVSSPEFQTNENPGFILLNTYNQNDPTAQDRLIADLAIQKTWITSFGIPAEVFEQGIINMPLVEQGANFNVPVNRLVTEYNGAQAGSLLIPYSQADGQSKVAIFEDEDGAGDDTLIDVLGLIPKENSSITEPKALPTLLKKGPDGTYVAIRVFEVPMTDNSSQSEVPTVIGTPVYQAQVITDSLNLRDPVNPTVVMSQVGRNENIMLISDRKITVPGKNYVLREALVDGQIALVAENLLEIKPAVGSAEYNDPMNRYAYYLKSAENITAREGIGIKSVDIATEAILADVPARPIVFVQTNEMDNQPPKYRPGRLQFNNVPNLVGIYHDALTNERPNLVLDGQEVALDGAQTLQLAFAQSFWRMARGSQIIPADTTIETFLREYQNLTVPVWGKGGEFIDVRVDAPIVIRVRDFEPEPRQGLISTQFGSFERSLVDGNLVIDVYYESKYLKKTADFTTDGMDSDDRVTSRMMTDVVLSLPFGARDGGFVAFNQLYGVYFAAEPKPVDPNTMMDTYNANVQVLPSAVYSHYQRLPETTNFKAEEFQIFNFS